MITYRPTSLEDLNTVDALVVSSINDLTNRHGFGRIAAPSTPRFQTYSLDEDSRGLWTAEENGKPVGFAWSWACEDFWFLARLFVEPNLQARGVGRELLKHMLDHAEAVSARQRALITFAFNTVSQGLYIQHGFLPRFPIYAMKIARDALPKQTGAALTPLPLGDFEHAASALAAVDRAAIGFSRTKHHRLLAAEPGVRTVGLHDDGRMVGYAYVSASGHIGPLGVVSPELAQPAFSAALTLGAETDSENVSCFVPGSNTQVLRRASEIGMRITLPMLMMSTEEIGNWTCYLPRNPGFM